MSEQFQEVLRLEALRKSYNIGQPNEVEVLHGIDLCIERQDWSFRFRKKYLIEYSGITGSAEQW